MLKSFLLAALLMITALPAYCQYSDRIIPYNELGMILDSLPGYFGQVRPKLKPMPERLKEIAPNAPLGKDTATFIFAMDSLRVNDVLLHCKMDRNDTSKLIFQLVHFTRPVFVVGKNMNREIEFRHCHFDKSIVLTGDFEKKISFEMNTFADDFQIGMMTKDSSLNSFSENVTLRQNIFAKPFRIYQAAFRDSVYLYNNYFADTEISGSVFHKCFDSQSNGFGGYMKLSFIKSQEEFRFRDSEFRSSFRISNSRFSANLVMDRCRINSLDKTSRDGLIYQCYFAKFLRMSGSDIQHVKIHNTFFEKDSSALVLSRSSIQHFEVVSSTYPYLIDLSNAHIADSGIVNLADIPVIDPTDLNLSSSINFVKRNRHCYLYLDNTPLRNIRFDYSDFTLASVYYDPNIEGTTKDMSFEISPYSDYQLESTGEPSLLPPNTDFVTFAMTEQPGMLPPFPDSAWKRIARGLVSKENLYNSVLQKFKDENDSKSYAKLDIEYKRFMLLELDPGLYNTFRYYAGKLWWDFGYKKSRIFLWIVLFFIVFSLLNSRRLYFLSNKVYVIENISNQLRVHKKLKQIRLAGLPAATPTPDQINSEDKKPVPPAKKGIDIPGRSRILTRYYTSTLLLSFVYTGFIFFGLRMDVNKFHLKRNVATVWVLLIYTTGIICTGFVINLILH